MTRRLWMAIAGAALTAVACGSGEPQGQVLATAPPTSAPSTPSSAPTTLAAETVEGDDGATTTDAPSAAAPETTAAVPATTTPVAVPSQLAFVGPAVGGGEVDLSVYAGTDTIAWFWAPW